MDLAGPLFGQVPRVQCICMTFLKRRQRKQSARRAFMPRRKVTLSSGETQASPGDEQDEQTGQHPICKHCLSQSFPGQWRAVRLLVTPPASQGEPSFERSINSIKPVTSRQDSLIVCLGEA